jgi:hypothetical protein
MNAEAYGAHMRQDLDNGQESQMANKKANSMKKSLELIIFFMY